MFFWRGYNSHGDLQQHIFLSGSGWLGQPEGTTLTMTCNKILLFFSTTQCAVLAAMTNNTHCGVVRERRNSFWNVNDKGTKVQLNSLHIQHQTNLILEYMRGFSLPLDDGSSKLLNSSCSNSLLLLTSSSLLARWHVANRHRVVLQRSERLGLHRPKVVGRRRPLRSSGPGRRRADARRPGPARRGVR